MSSALAGRAAKRLTPPPRAGSVARVCWLQDQRPMVKPWRITALLLALLPALAQPAAAGEFSVEEQKLVADIRQKMDQTTQLLIYAYENEEKMDLAEMQRVLAGFGELSRFFSNIPDQRFERRTGSFCVGAGASVWIYWSDTVSYYRFRGDDYAKYTGAALTLESLRERQKRNLEGHFWSFLKCRIHLDQIPTQPEDETRAKKIKISAIIPIREESLKLMKLIEKNKENKNKAIDEAIALKSKQLFQNYYSIYNMRISDGSLFCEALVDMPLFVWKDYVKRYGPSSKTEQLRDDLYHIGFDFMIKQYYKSVTLCDNYVTKYKEKRP
ncbi:hypothetical protein [Elstera sp.]|uniref:hypothetical protein n=1 Tax=Elstera sp. TaxID=1916664 RepID=UPI0037C11DB3